jgi:chromosome segregation ATPase
MDAKELQAMLQKLERSMDLQSEFGGVRKDLIRLRERIRRLKSDKQRLEAENQRLSRQLNSLNTPGSK